MIWLAPAVVGLVESATDFRCQSEARHLQNIERTNVMPRRLLLTPGQIFTRLTVIGPALDAAMPYLTSGGTTSRKSRSRCLCTCGKRITVYNSLLVKGLTKSCGCLQKEIWKSVITKHGYAGTRTHRCWKNMIQRCTNPNHDHFHLYGGRGIKVCSEWRNFEAFLKDNGPCPPGKQLDRWPNNNGNYQPGNTRWATRVEQARNCRSNHIFTAFGIAGCLPELCERFQKPYKLIKGRIDRGWNIERALQTPELPSRWKKA